MGLFSKWRDGKDYDLERLGVPRLTSPGPVIVENIRPLNPFVLDNGGEPTVVIRLEGLPESEVHELAAAVADDHCLLMAGWKLYSTYPLLIFSLLVYDSPGSPLGMEGYREVTSADVQDFVVSLGRNRGEGRVQLYNGTPPELIASGRFQLRIPPFIVPTKFPYRTSRVELELLWLMFKIAAKLRERIPEGDLDFKAAVKTHMAHEPTMSSRTDFGDSGVISRS